MSTSHPTIVHARTDAPDDRPTHRIEESSAAAVLDAVAKAPEGAQILVAVDAAVIDTSESPSSVDHEALVALVSVLAIDGVRSFETRFASSVRRILDVHTAIVAGAIEVIES